MDKEKFPLTDKEIKAVKDIEAKLHPNLTDMVRERETLCMEIRELEFRRRQLEQEVVSYLVQHKMTAFFTVNWRKLDAAQHKMR